MPHRRRPIRPAHSVLAAVLLAGALSCAAHAQVAATDYDHSVNFLKYKTYTVQKIHATDPGVESRLVIALDRNLQARYLHPGDANADLILAVVQSSHDPAEYTNFYAGLTGLGWERSWSSGFMEGSPMVGDLKPGTLVLDMWDRRSGKLVWRGAITEPGSVTSSKEADQKLDKAVGQLLAKFPPKPDNGAK
ncbi:MAG: DUF4136 domain-containing protein [Acidobacteriota bacterium]|nr:DUF4136 domain-containing protein [Acidobacteriota bacterium]